jgi:hypothetical protein
MVGPSSASTAGTERRELTVLLVTPARPTCQLRPGGPRGRCDLTPGPLNRWRTCEPVARMAIQRCVQSGVCKVAFGPDNDRCHL